MISRACKTFMAWRAAGTFAGSVQPGVSPRDGLALIIHADRSLADDLALAR
jgi:hypothetical protein